MSCPHCGQTAEFHSHREHTSLSLVGPVRYRRAYYLCRRCGKGLFPFDREAGLTARALTPALERVASLAGVEIGARVATSLPETTLRRLFAVLLFAVAAQLVWRATREQARYPDSSCSS